MIPPTPKQKNKIRVAAYCRVSTQKDEQMHSLAAQIDYYTNLLSADEEREFAGVYADEGISGTRAKNRSEFLRLIEDCRSGKVNAIVTKSVSRFGRNTVDTLTCTREQMVGTARRLCLWIGDVWIVKRADLRKRCCRQIRKHHCL